MAGHPVPVWEDWEGLAKESRTLSTHNPTAFIQDKSVGSKFSTRCAFNTHKRNTGIQQQNPASIWPLMSSQAILHRF